MISPQHYRKLLLTTAAITVVGVTTSVFALDAANDAANRAFVAHAIGDAGALTGSGPSGVASPSPLHVRRNALDAQAVALRAEAEEARATLALGVAGTLTPVLLLLTVLALGAPHRGDAEVEERSPV